MVKGYIVGAGFSKAFSKLMPVTEELMKDVLSELEPEDASKVNSIAFNNDIESLLTYLAEEQPWLDEKTSLQNRRLFIVISKLISETITKRQTEALMEVSNSLDVHWSHTAMATWLNGPSRVVSLNYDLLIEILFVHYIKNPQISYDSLFTTVVSLALDREGNPRNSRPPQETPMVLYKLHGSINWYYSGSKNFYGEPIYDINLGNFIPEIEQKKLPPGLLYRTGRASNDKIPLIVPPTVHKETFFKNEFIRAQWRTSFENLSKCEEIYCLGYSLPKSDVMMRFYISEVLKNSCVKMFYIVNKQDNDEKREELIKNYKEAFSSFLGKLNFSFVKPGEPIVDLFKTIAPKIAPSTS